MFEEFNKNIDLVINESEKPVLIIGNPGDGKVTHLKDKYKTYIVSLNNIFRYSIYDNDLVSNRGDLTKKPTWYLDFLALCEKYPSEKCLIIFDELGKVTEDVIASLYSIILNEDEEFSLPDNATIVCTMNGFYDFLAESLNLPETFLQCFTVLNGKDKNNIEIEWNNDVKKR